MTALPDDLRQWQKHQARPHGWGFRHLQVRYEERVVITKVLVPVERVRLVKQIVTSEQVVTGQVRAERIDVDVVRHPDGQQTST